MTLSLSHYAARVVTLTLVVTLSLVVSGCTTPGDAKTSSAHSTEAVAWWLEQEFAPTQQQLKGIELAEFDGHWRQATVLEPQLLREKLSRRQYQEFERSEQRLALDAELNGGGEAERFFVGVYSNDTSATGRFLAIVEDGEVLQVFQHPGPLTYSGLLFIDGELRWYKCMICDDFDIITWSGSSYELSYRQHSPTP